MTDPTPHGLEVTTTAEMRLRSFCDIIGRTAKNFTAGAFPGRQRRSPPRRRNPLTNSGTGR